MNIYVRVRYAECDPQGVVFNPRYGEYVDLAMTEYMRAAFGGYKGMIDKGVDCQTVRLLIEWKSSASFDDILRINIEPTKFGNTSIRFEFAITELRSNRLVATAEAVYVTVNAESFEKIAIPDFMHTAMGDNALQRDLNLTELSEAELGLAG